MDNRSLSLESLSDNLLTEIAEDNFRVSDYIAIGGESCWRFHGLFGAERRLGLRILQKLLTHVVQGEQSEAEFLIKLFPDLLILKGRVRDYSGRIIEGTALQIALGAEDVRYREDEECMAEMIQRHLRKQFTNSEEIISAQVAEQFPEGWEEKENERAKKDLEALNEVVKAISQSQTDADCDKALNKFSEYLKPKSIIKTGKHFNFQLFVKAFDLFEENYDKFGDNSGRYNSRKNILFWQKVIGCIQRYLPACFAQALCQGIIKLVERGQKLERSLKFKYRRDDALYFPLDSDPHFRLGDKFAVSVGGSAEWHGDPGGLAKGERTRLFANYDKRKTSTLRGFLPQRSDNTYAKSRCVIM